MSGKNSSKIHFIITGGTIDSVWSGAHDTVVVSKHSVLPEYFENLGTNLKFYEEFEFSEVCMKDSRAITEEIRKKIVGTITKTFSGSICLYERASVYPRRGYQKY